ncbi:MAG: M48 family metallopeptidase [Chromatiales bacterium]|nr:M48 family metallopeptidase [Chromatiales bacterium]
MDFFQRQEQARKNSRRLVLLFITAVLCIVVAINLVAGFLLGGMRPASVPLSSWLQQNPGFVAAVTGIALLIIIGASAFRIFSLRGGGSTVAESLGGTAVPQDTRDPLERRLRNVVEEMAIASSLPVPEIYVLKHESGINAFAAGFTQSDAAVAVTQGTLDQLNRDELQGVIAHEFSHILNGDMRLNLRLMGTIFGILAISQLGRLLLRSGRWSSFKSRSSNRNGGSAVAAIMFLGVSLFLIGSIGVFFARLIKAGVSRQREYLADASAVQFTRQNAGIAGALKKIAGLGIGSRISSANAEEISHMLFASGMRFFSRMMSTHPPLEDRIRALDPSFKGTIESRPGAVTPGPGAMGLAAGVQQLDGATVAGLAGSPASAHIDHAAGMLQTLPVAMLEDLHSTQAAPRVIMALFLNPADAQRDAQLKLLSARLGSQAANDILAQQQQLADLPRQLRLPVLELSFPALRRLPETQRSFYLELGRELVEHDAQVDYHEFALLQVLEVYLRDLARPRRPMQKRQSKRKVFPAISRLFSFLAQAGQADTELAKQAFQLANNQLFPKLPDSQRPPFLANEPDVHALWDDLSLLDQLAPRGKRRLIQAMTDLILHDKKQEILEVELLRCFAASLHIPLPPMDLAAISQQ